MRRLNLAAALMLGASGALAQSVEERLETCASCHGADGISQMEGVPSLAGQQAAYTVVQLYMFRQNLRPGTVMTEFAQGLSDADLQALADHYAALPPPQPEPPSDPASAERGRALAATHRCGVCHGPGYGGQQQVARIGGQREDYLIKALTEYKSGARPGYEPIMSSVMAPISEADITDLAHFIAHKR